MDAWDNHRRLGAALKAQRNALGLTLENVSAKISARGQKLSAQHLSNLETAYSRPGKEPTTPPDELLNTLAEVLNIPIRELHAALGRIPDGRPAAQLIHEKVSDYRTDITLTEQQMDALISEIEDFAELRLSRTVRQLQEAA